MKTAILKNTLTCVLFITCAFNQAYSQIADSGVCRIPDDYGIMYFMDCLNKESFEKLVISRHNSIYLNSSYVYVLDFRDVSFYIGELAPDIGGKIYWSEMVSSYRKESGDTWLSGTTEFDYYSADTGRSNQIFHEVLVDGLFVCYYLKGDEPNKLIEKCFQDYLWKYHGYRREYDQFPFIHFK